MPSSKLLKTTMHDNKFDLMYELTYDNGSIEHIFLKGVENPFSTYPAAECFYSSHSNILDRVLHCKSEVAFKECHKELIKGPDPIEVTITDIENKFGRPVKIVNTSI